MFSFDIHSHVFSHVHFIGIGGISMSGLAEILLSNDYKVSGSDMKNSPILNRLKQDGATIYIGHNRDNIKDADLVVYTSAISLDNPEYVEAMSKGITLVDRATFLGQLMKGYENSIAVAGTHGKTTTTGMVSIILDKSKLAPTILLGGELDQIGGNVKIGGNECLLTEACEYKGNFLKFYPTIGIVLNIEEDHLDYFQDINHIVNTFKDFANLIPPHGTIVINNDDQYANRVISDSKCNIVTFGLKNESEFMAKDIEYTTDGFPKYSLFIKGQEAGNVTLNVMGIHNVYNSLASIAATYISGVELDTIIESIKTYGGTHRRFENKGFINGIRIIDDYAHHPTEIKASLSTARKLTDGKLWCIFQPHTYTRTKALLDEFSVSFFEADEVIVADIYAAREKDTGLIHSRDLVSTLDKNGVNSIYLSDFSEIVNYISRNANEGDIVITMGAGDIYEVGEMILEKV